MRRVNLILAILTIFILSSCSGMNNKIFWVSGLKTKCSAGAGTKECLNIHRGEDVENAKWENFYANIEGFEFEEGFLKKIEVREKTLKNVPADASSIKYTLIREIEKIVDERTKLEGDWILATLNDLPINRSVRLPDMTINLTERKVSGSGGCNNYFGQINELTGTSILFENIASTKRACIDQNDIESEYLAMLNEVKSYKIDEGQLVFYNDKGNELLRFLKKTEQANQRLHDIWAVTKINESEIDDQSSRPTIEFNLTEMKVFGNDTCNQFSGGIIKVSDTEIVLGELIATAKMCKKMDVADSFYLALKKVHTYQLDGLNLALFDEDGQEVLAFLKVD